MYRNDDPPAWLVEETPCIICGRFAEDCICPECEVCGEQGNPSCINTHMPWNKWYSSLLRQAYEPFVDEDDDMFEDTLDLF